MHAEIIAIGTELLTPFRQDTNSLYLTEKLNQLGVEVRFKSVVGDRREDLVSVARLALARSGVVVFMGGLGPTEDDLTRECVAEALGVELKRDPDIIAGLYKRFASTRSKMPGAVGMLRLRARPAERDSRSLSMTPSRDFGGN